MKKITIQSVDEGKKGERPTHEVNVTKETPLLWVDTNTKEVWSKLKFKQI